MWHNRAGCCNTDFKLNDPIRPFTSLNSVIYIGDRYLPTLEKGNKSKIMLNVHGSLKIALSPCDCIDFLPHPKGHAVGGLFVHC